MKLVRLKSRQNIHISVMTHCEYCKKGIMQNKNLKNLQVLQNNWHVGQKQINNPEQQFEEQLSRMANCKTC